MEKRRPDEGASGLRSANSFTTLLAEHFSHSKRVMGDRFDSLNRLASAHQFRSRTGLRPADLGWSPRRRTLMLMPTPSASADVRQPLAHTRTRLGRFPRAAGATARSSLSGAGRVLRRGAELHREGDPAGATRVLDHVGAPLCRVECARRRDGEGAQRRIDSGRQGSDEIVGTESRGPVDLPNPLSRRGLN